MLHCGGPSGLPVLFIPRDLHATALPISIGMLSTPASAAVPVVSFGFFLGCLIRPCEVLESPQNRSQAAGIQRFDQMKMNTGLFRAALVCCGAAGSKGNANRFFLGRLLLKPPGNLPAIHPRQANLQEYHIRWIGLGHLQSGLTIPGHLNLVSISLKK